MNDYYKYITPPVSLLTSKPFRRDDDSLYDEEFIESILANYNAPVSVINVIPGPTLTRYEMKLGRGVKFSKIKNLEDDLQVQLNAYDVAIELVTERGIVALDILRRQPDIVYLKDIIETDDYLKSKSMTPICMGKSMSGEAVIADLAGMPHLLVAGSTGSGKSVFLHSAILSILFKASPDQVKFILIDTKKVELTSYRGIPHLLAPVIIRPDMAYGALNWAAGEMEDRYDKFMKEGVHDLDSYNEIVRINAEEYKALPRIVIVIDDYADLTMNSDILVEEVITRIAQKGRASGIHLIIATQKPSSCILKGNIKANIPARVSFELPGIWDSRAILDTGGAEKLVGKGDMLYKPAGYSQLDHLVGCYTPEEDVRVVVGYLIQNSNSSES